jgi:hypothetical protein
VADPSRTPGGHREGAENRDRSTHIAYSTQLLFALILAACGATPTAYAGPERWREGGPGAFVRGPVRYGRHPERAPPGDTVLEELGDDVPTAGEDGWVRVVGPQIEVDALFVHTRCMNGEAQSTMMGDTFVVRVRLWGEECRSFGHGRVTARSWRLDPGTYRVELRVEGRPLLEPYEGDHRVAEATVTIPPDG